MRRRPWGIILAAFAFAITPAESYFSSQPITLPGIIVDWVFPIILALGLFFVTRIGWYMLFAMLAVYGFRDMYMQLAREGLPPAAFMVNALGYVLTVFYFLNPRIQRLYFDHRLHWWRSEKRSRVEIPILLQSKKGTLYGILANISTRGCFIQCPDTLLKTDVYDLKMLLPGGAPDLVVELRAVIRWEKPGVGYGFEFVGEALAFPGLLSPYLPFLKKHAALHHL